MSKKKNLKGRDKSSVEAACLNERDKSSAESLRERKGEEREREREMGDEVEIFIYVCLPRVMNVCSMEE